MNANGIILDSLYYITAFLVAIVNVFTVIASLKTDGVLLRKFLLFLAFFSVFGIPIIVQTVIKSHAFSEASIASSSINISFSPSFSNSIQPTQPPPSANFTRLDSSLVIDSSKGNFFINGWGDKTAFKSINHTYDQGIGMSITGTDDEKVVRDMNNEDGEFHNTSKEVYILFALYRKYEKITFSVGVDRGIISCCKPEKSGKAQVIISDKESDIPFFDSGWKDFSYWQEDVTITGLSDVNVLKITFRSDGEGSRLPLNRLRFVIVNPSLYSIEDCAEDMVS